jgi:hypothetical protein
MSKDEGGRNSSFSEKPVRSRLRRLVDWINLTGAKKVHSLIDKVYKRKNLEMARACLPSTTVLQEWSSTKRTTRELPEQNPCDGLSKRSNGPGVMPLHAYRANPEGGT